MRKMLLITLSFIVLLITSCDSGGDGNSVDESALEGLWALSEQCIEVRSCEYAQDNECETAGDGFDDIVVRYIFINDGTTYECDGDSGDLCWSGTYTISGSSFEECDDDPNCEEHEDSYDCFSDYGCEWGEDGCFWADFEDDDVCSSGTVNLSDDNETMTIVISGNYGDCVFTETSTFNKIGDSLEDYENLGDN